MGLSQVRVSAPMAVRVRFCRGLRRVVSVMWRLLAVSWWRRTRLRSRRARAAVRCWSGEVGVSDVGLGEGVVDEGFD